MLRLHGLLVTSRPLVCTQPSRCSKSIAPYTPFRRAGAGGISLRLMLWVTPRFARCDLVFLPEKPAAIVRSLPCAQALLPLVAGIPSENLFHALACRSLISWKTFLLPAGARACTSVRLTNRHFVPSRAKNEEEGGRGSRSPIHQPPKGRTHHHGTAEPNHHPPHTHRFFQW